MTVLAPGGRTVSVRPGRALAAAATAVLYAVGWAAAIVVFGALWAAASVRTGWSDGRKAARR